MVIIHPISNFDFDANNRNFAHKQSEEIHNIISWLLLAPCPPVRAYYDYGPLIV